MAHSISSEMMTVCRRVAFLVLRAIPMAALSISVGLVVLSLTAPEKPIRELIVVLMIPLLLFHVLVHILRAVLPEPPDPSEHRRLFPSLTTHRVAPETGIAFGVVLATTALMFAPAWPVYQMVGLGWSAGLVLLIAAGHLG